MSDPVFLISQGGNKSPCVIRYGLENKISIRTITMRKLIQTIAATITVAFICTACATLPADEIASDTTVEAESVHQQIISTETESEDDFIEAPPTLMADSTASEPEATSDIVKKPKE